METPVIRYNLKDRGRQHTGQPRCFNIKAICDAINSPACQETVSARAMIGFYGHLPRVRYGLVPVEGGIEGGKYAPVEPAFVTTHLKASYDGTVEHRAEFLDTAAGKLAQKLWEGRVGGFSSAIDQGKPEFFGFDYVANPNYLANSFRGVVLDDAMGGHLGSLTYDDVYSAEQDEQAQAMVALLDGIAAERVTTNAVIERLSAENEQLLSLLAAVKGDAAAVSAALDAAAVMPVAVSVDPADRLRRDADFFRHAVLPQVVIPEPDVTEAVPMYERLLSRLW